MINTIIFIGNNRKHHEGIDLAIERGLTRDNCDVTSLSEKLRGIYYINIIVLGNVDEHTNGLLHHKEVNCGCTVERIY